ncbi:MAG: hypothetical protein SynsKO_32660 [Synoicihabitans sp.]
MLHYLPLPAPGIKPQHFREFLIAETGLDADSAVMTADGVGADENAKQGESRLEDANPAWFASHDGMS